MEMVWKINWKEGMHEHGRGQHNSNNNHSYIGGQGEWLMSWLVRTIVHAQMGTIADNGLAINNNRPQNGDGDGVGDKSEGGCEQT